MLRWSLHLARLALLLTWLVITLAVLLPALVDGVPLTAANLVALFAAAAPSVLPAVLTTLCVCVLLIVLLGKIPMPGLLRGGLALATTLGVPALWVVFTINRRHLPGFFETISIVSNLAMLAAFLGFAFLGGVGLARWVNAIRADRGRPAWLTTAVLLLATAAPLPLAMAMQAKAGPNVIVLLIDALRYDHLSCYGYERPTSPNIDRFAAESVVFDQAISASTFTRTSIASLLTGLHPHVHGVFRGIMQGGQVRPDADVLEAEHQTLAEALSDYGMISVAWVQNPQIQDFMGFAQGFARYTDWAGNIHMINEKFLSWQGGLGRFSRFFAYLHYLDLHDPYRPPAHVDDLYGQEVDLYEELDFANDGVWQDQWLKIIREINSGERPLSEAGVQQMRNDYDELIHAIDEALGRFFQELRDRGIYDDSIIILTSDHGDAFMEHGFISHANTPYDELIRVPLIVKLPGSAGAGLTVEEQVAAVDVMPTILDLVDAPPPRKSSGRSLEPLMMAGETEREDESSHTFVEFYKTVGVRTDAWKMLYFGHDDHWEIFDLRADPGELHDLSLSPPPEVAPLQALVMEALKERSAHQPKTVPLDEATVKALRALGYVE